MMVYLVIVTNVVIGGILMSLLLVVYAGDLVVVWSGARGRWGKLKVRV